MNVEQNRALLILSIHSVSHIAVPLDFKHNNVTSHNGRLKMKQEFTNSRVNFQQCVIFAVLDLNIKFNKDAKCVTDDCVTLQWPIYAMHR